MRRRAVWALPLLALISTGCGNGSPAAEAAKTPASAGQPVVVAVERPRNQSLSKEFILTGEFRPYQVADLHAKVAGYLQSITVDVGSAVQAGQVIATLEIPEMQAELATAAADRRRMEAEVERARTEIQRAEANLKIQSLSYDRLNAASKAEPGLVAQQEIDEALARRAAAEAQLAAARAALQVEERRTGFGHAVEERTRTLAAYGRILAPFAGIVTKRYADPGAMIQAGTASQSQAMPVVRVAQISRLRLVAAVGESQVPMIRPGQTVEVRIPSLNRSIQASVSRLTNDVLSTSRTMEAEIDVANPSGELKPGMYADIVTNLARRGESLTIPASAVINAGGNRSVLLVNSSGLVEERPIRTGLERESTLEILSGLTATDQVIVSNRTLLRPGLKVEPREAAPN